MVDDAGMPFELKATRKEFELVDASGYRFRIVAEQATEGDRIGAWSATLTIKSSGFVSDEAAINFLRAPAQHFLRMLGEARE